ncbi:MAG: hypothetical protein ACJZ72_03355 [Opitutales bacterium]
MKFSFFPLKEGTSALVSGGNKEFFTLNNGSGGIGPVTGFPFFEGERFSVLGVEQD